MRNRKKSTTARPLRRPAPTGDLRIRQLEARLAESRAQQAATSEILRAISQAHTDQRPAFEAIADSAMRLLNALTASVFRLDGDFLHPLATRGGPAGSTDAPVFRQPLLVTRDSVNGRCIVDRSVVHFADIQADPDAPKMAREMAIIRGFRAGLCVPLLRDARPIGTIAVTRAEAGAFSDDEIALLQTFADQAVIAIENVRLFTELEVRNKDLAESLDRQMGTAEILQAISASPTDVQPVFRKIVQTAARLCRATASCIYLLDGDRLNFVAPHNLPPDWPATLPTTDAPNATRVIRDGSLYHVIDTETDPGITTVSLQLARRAGIRSMLHVPMKREGTVIGSIVVFRAEAGSYSENHIALLQTFADQAVIAIENVRLFTETKEALERQTATSEILRVISSSPTDVQPVFDTIAESAAKLCDGLFGTLTTFDGKLIHLASTYNWPPEAREMGARIWPMRPRRELATSRAIVDRAVVHVPDVETDYRDPLSQQLIPVVGYRSVLAVPMLRDGVPLGVVAVARAVAGPFSDSQIALLKTFADQAVIAIENARLFNELQARTQDLSRSVDQLTALGEVGRAVSSTLDLDALLNTIVSRACQLAAADDCSIYEYVDDAEQFELRATHSADPEFVEALRATRMRKGEGLMGRSAELRQPVQVPDIMQPGAYESRAREILTRFGSRALLAVPLLREDRVVGSLTLIRNTPGEFSREIVEVVKTFATNSALALQNAQLFRELEAKTRQLEIANRHKSEFLANVSHELRTPMNAILGFNELILDGIYGDVDPELQVPLTDIQNSGRHLLRLINNVLDLSKIEAGRMDLTLGDYLVHDTVASVRNSLASLAAQRGLHFVATVPDDVPLARGDAGRITQCLMNLAGNALKFTREGRVEIAVERRGDLLRYRVSDTGIGIAKEELETIFGEFRQADSTITREFGGTGLGLSITKKFVEMHGGRIWVESEPGVGSTFSFEIPLRVEPKPL